MQRTRVRASASIAGIKKWNTEHPHVHIVLRSLRHDGETLRFSRQYVQQGIREIADHLCTRELGYRTQLDAAEAERREIAERRFTSLDRRLIRDASEISLTDGQQYFAVVRNSSQLVASEKARLAVLQRMRLAESTAGGTWLVRRDFEQILRAMQRTADRQKTLAAHGALMSDERLPIEILDLSRMTKVEGRVLVHGQDEQSGRSYLMLEGTDAKVYLIHYTPELEEARSCGELRVNSFVRLRNLSANGTPIFDIKDLGNAEALLSNRAYLSNVARKFLNGGIRPGEDGWGGWLGKYQAALAKATINLRQFERDRLARTSERQQQRDVSFGR